MEIYYFIAAYFLFYSAYTSLHIVLGQLFYKKPLATNLEQNQESVVVLFPAFKPDLGFPERLARMKKALDFPFVHFFVVLQQSTKEMEDAISLHSDLCIHVEKPIETSGNPYHSILRFSVNKAKEFNPKHLLLLDMDNEIDTISFQRLLSFRNEFDLIQAKRVAQSSKTNSISQFDSLSESLNDSMMRASRSILKAPIELSGSGFIADFELLSDAIHNLDSKAPGMDKNLLIQLLSLKPSIKMLFDEEAVVTDEKTTEIDSYSRQRTRWFGNQYYNARTQFFPLLRLALRSTRFGIADYGISLCRPPRSFQIIILFIGTLLEFVAHFMGYSNPFLFLIASVIYAFGLSLFLFKHRNQFSFSSVFSMLSIALKNSFLALKSFSPSLKGTFLNTRKEEK